MLDQNTDRMWYVIGAVIVGAAIILILNGTAPSLFASVADTFQNKTDDVSGKVDDLALTDGMGPVDISAHQADNLIDMSDMEPGSFDYLTGKDVDHQTQFERLKEPIPITSNTRYYLAHGLVPNPGESWGTEMAWIFYDAEMKAIPGDHVFSYHRPSRNDVVFTTPSSAEYVRVRFGISTVVGGNWDRRDYFLAELATITR